MLYWPLADYHESLYLTAKEEDELYEAYQNNKKRTIPTPREIRIAMRQLREQRLRNHLLELTKGKKNAAPD